jgi:hypothetical protein
MTDRARPCTCFARGLRHYAHCRRKASAPGEIARDRSSVLPVRRWQDFTGKTGRPVVRHSLRLQPVLGPAKIEAADKIQAFDSGFAPRRVECRSFLQLNQNFLVGVRNSDSPFARPIAGMPLAMRQRSRAIEQSPSCEPIARWMPIRACRGVFGSASSVAGGESR